MYILYVYIYIYIYEYIYIYTHVDTVCQAANASTHIDTYSLLYNRFACTKLLLVKRSTAYANIYFKRARESEISCLSEKPLGKHV